MFEDVRDLYNATILARGRKPLHMRRLGEFDGTARGDNPMCGDRVQVWVRRDGAGAVAEAGFEARGCEISKASADLMVEAVQGHGAAQIGQMFAQFTTMARTGACPDCAAFTALRPLASVHEYPSRVKCATLPWHALMAALHGQEQASSE
ncbi:MAG: SUF system NifU family Fe-S cluster assembly protein [Rhodospirillales bacterium]|nr:SUF system NifU family Fe-S cluster assembly protein [Rhodospirillales bacterium]MDE2198300.1 SUF system NifU family Fe-S cluster assembly protein [Rhodospirillales bacterium]MDE2574208.1 SUF system NifU family Fe-S cluster assembly protein [Rhodospirillales bacterium]